MNRRNTTEFGNVVLLIAEAPSPQTFGKSRSAIFFQAAAG